MNEAASSTAESSLLLWLLAGGMAVLTLHVALGWVRQAQRDPGLRHNWRALLLAAGTLGTGLCSVAVLAQGAEALSFPLGYRALWAPGLWLGSMVGSFAVTWLLAHNQRWWTLLVCGVGLALLTAGVQFGWIAAAGFRPGVLWRTDFLAAAVILLIVGLGAALGLGFSQAIQEGERRHLWRLGGAVLAGLTITAAQQVLMLAANLTGQVGSVYLHEVPGAVLALLCGVLLPLVYSVIAIDLVMRTQGRRHSSHGPGSAFAGKRRRKRRHRVRTL
jgi:NO-binding membrane sensor protein with MHYT domain